MTTIEKKKAVAEASARASLSPEFVDHHAAKAIFSLGRQQLYDLSEKGRIKSVSLREKGAIKGRRLWVTSSIRDYLNSCIVTAA